MPTTQEQARELLAALRRDKLKAPATIEFGRDALAKAGKLAAILAGDKAALIVTGASAMRRHGHLERLTRLLGAAGVPYALWAGVRGEPTTESVDAGAALARRTKPGLLISLGGGSAIDTAKALAALATNEGPVEDYLEGVGRGRPLARPALPHLAIPTVAGTGAEMTRNAVIGVPARGVKRSLRAETMIPSAAVVDPALTLSVPPEVTAAGGLDTLTQLFEACLTLKRRPETTRLALAGLRLGREALRTAYTEPGDYPAREKLALASLLSGVCLANAGLGMAHGIAAALGARCGLAHGLACGILLPHVLAYNRSGCPAELAAALAAFLNREPPGATTLDEGLAALRDLNRHLGVAADLRFLQLDAEQRAALAEGSMGNSMAGNPRAMTPESVRAFLDPLC